MAVQQIISNAADCQSLSGFVTAAATAFAGCVLIVVNCSLFRFFFCYFARNLV